MHTLPIRIGVLVPSLDPVVEYDFQRFLPDTVSFHVGRLDQPSSSKTASDEGLARMCGQAPEKARALADLGAELIAFCCTSASFFRGPGWDLELAGRIEAAAGVPALTTSTAVAEALAHLRITRAFMVTPYRRDINRREQIFFRAHGVEIPAFTSFECAHSHEIDKITPGAIAERVLAERAGIDACDGVFVSCTALRAMEAIPRLEQALGKPVASSNAAMMWAVLQRLEIDSRGVRGGRLFEGPGSPRPARVA